MRKKKTETDTPANDAGSDVATDLTAPLDLRFFTSGDEQLPDIPDDDNRIGRLADIFHASGYWPALSPAQIAVQILAGESIGLTPAAAMFDLRIKQGDGAPRVLWAIGQPLQAAGDDADRTRAHDIIPGVTKDLPIDAGDKLRFVLPDNGTVIAAGASDPINVLEFQTSKGDAKISGMDPFESPADILARTELIDSALAIDDETANKGVLSDPGNETPNGQDEGLQIDSRADSVEMPADLTEGVTADPPAIDDPDPDPTISDDDREWFRRSQAERVRQAEPAPDPGPGSQERPSDMAAIGNVEVTAWRTAVDKMFSEIGFSSDRRKQSLEKFDAADIPEKAKLFEAASNYYRLELDKGRTKVLAALKADGKETPDQCAGFFLFADTDHNPDHWTLRDVKKALVALSEFGIG
jgi:hypothetical protein